jgi:hypothetical protein
VADDLAEGRLVQLLGVVDLLQLAGQVVQETLSILARGGAGAGPFGGAAPRVAGLGRGWILGDSR